MGHGGELVSRVFFIIAMVILAFGVFVPFSVLIVRSFADWRRRVQLTNRIAEMYRIQSTESVSADDRSGIHRVVELGVPQAELTHSFPLVIFSKTDAHLAPVGKNGHMIECPVCLIEYKEAEHVLRLPNCEHIFHSICIKTWLQSHTTCPICRTDVQVYKDEKQLENQSSLQRVLCLMGRDSQILDSSASDRHPDRQQVTLSVTPPLQRHSANTSGPVLLIGRDQTGHEHQEDQGSEAPAPSMSSNAMEARMIFSPICGSSVDIHEAGPSSS